jgi:tripartite-type tricarboxylate transporter receptor subunit TctC
MNTQNVVKRIHADVEKLLRWPEVKTAFDRVGTYPIPKDPRAFRDYLKSEFAKWARSCAM